MKNFNEYFSLDQFKQASQNYDFDAKKSNSQIGDGYAKAKAAVNEGLGGALAQYLIDRHKEKSFSVIPRSEGHDNDYLNSWNKFIKTSNFDALPERSRENYFNGLNQEDMQDLVFDTADKLMLYNTMYSDKNPKNEENILENYKTVIQTVNNGNFFYFKSDMKCRCCGQNMSVHFQNWEPKVTTYDNKTNNPRAPLKTCFDKIIHSFDIEFKTGNLLIADWIRIPEFTKLVEYDAKHNEVSINFALGRHNQTKHYAEKYNFISVSVGNSSPNVILDGGTIVFGNYDPNKKSSDIKSNQELITVGTVCTDLWASTIIEKEHLIELLSEKMGMYKATLEVNKYLAENDVLQIQVQPGKYALKMHPDYEDFNKSLLSSQETSEKAQLYKKHEFTPFFCITSVDIVPQVQKRKKNKM